MSAEEACAAALAAQQRGDVAAALAHFARATECAPTLLPVRLAHAYARASAGDAAAARALLAATPGRDRLGAADARALAEAAVALRADAVADEALDRARRWAPDDTALLVAQAAVAERRGDAARALALGRRALALAPASRPVRLTVARLLAAQHEWDEALALVDAAVAAEPDAPLPRYQRGLLRLTVGDFAGGFQDAEARTALDWFRHAAPTHCPPWRGGRLAGRTLLAWGEQGLGDQLQFARFIPHLARATGARIVLRVAPPLVSLLADLPGADAVVASDAPWPAADAHVPLMSLPLRLGLLDEEAWDGAPMLRARAGTPDAPAGEPLRIALVWAGNPNHARDFERSLPLETLVPLTARPGVTWQSVQVGAAEAARQAHATLARTIAPTPPLADFTATADLLARCNLVLTVDTAVAHLAGALGRPTWLLVPPLPDWRWQRERTDSPWYDSVTCWRRPPGTAWTDVLARVGAALDARAIPPAQAA